MHLYGTPKAAGRRVVDADSGAVPSRSSGAAIARTQRGPSDHYSDAARQQRRPADVRPRRVGDCHAPAIRRGARTPGARVSQPPRGGRRGRAPARPSRRRRLDSRAWDLMERHSGLTLSFTDCVRAVTATEGRAAAVFGLDNDFRALGFTLSLERDPPMPEHGDRAMTHPDSFGARSTLTVAGTAREIYQLDALQDHYDVARLPYTLRILLENVLGGSQEHRDVHRRRGRHTRWNAADRPVRRDHVRAGAVLPAGLHGRPAR